MIHAGQCIRRSASRHDVAVTSSVPFGDLRPEEAKSIQSVHVLGLERAARIIVNVNFALMS
jgi:hypothetical protein